MAKKVVATLKKEGSAMFTKVVKMVKNEKGSYSFEEKIVNKDEIYQIKIQEIVRSAAKGKISTQKERKKYLYSVLNDKRIKQLIKDDEPKKAQKRAMLMLDEWK